MTSPSLLINPPPLDPLSLPCWARTISSKQDIRQCFRLFNGQLRLCLCIHFSTRGHLCLLLSTPSELRFCVLQQCRSQSSGNVRYQTAFAEFGALWCRLACCTFFTTPRFNSLLPCGLAICGDI